MAQESDARSVRYTVDGITLSGLECIPDHEPEATVVALHGGGYSAGYWNGTGRPSSSLLSLGARVGYRVIALDRPGYGESFGLVGDAVRIERQSEIVFQLLDAVRAGSDVGAGVFLMGHSLGAILSLRMAASARGDELAGIDVSGVPLHLDQGLISVELLSQVDHLPATPTAERRQLFYGPDGTFDPDVLSIDEAVYRLVPSAEIIDAAGCPDDMPRLAPQIRVPVQYTIAEHEVTSVSSPTILREAGALFVNAPRVLTHWQEHSGHNISLHKVGRAHHLRSFAFFDECLVLAATPDRRGEHGDG